MKKTFTGEDFYTRLAKMEAEGEAAINKLI